jgi:hypothetical protein
MTAQWRDEPVWLNSHKIEQHGALHVRVIERVGNPLEDPEQGCFDQLVLVEAARGPIIVGWWARGATKEELEERAQVLLDLCIIKWGMLK